MFSTPSKMARVIEVTLLLHNWIVELQDDAQIDSRSQDWMHIGGDEIVASDLYKVSGEEAKNVRDRLKDYLWHLR